MMRLSLSISQKRRRRSIGVTDLVFLEPAQRELEEIAKIHTNLADQIPQKKFNEPDSGYAFRFGTVSAARTYPAGLPSFTLASFWRPARWSHLNRRQVPYQERSASARGALRPGFDSLFFCSTKKRHPSRDVFFREAGEGNRTLNASLGSSNFTTKLRPHMRPAKPANDIILSFVQNFNYFSWNPAAFLF